jgi:hypothetical protein
MKYIIILLTLLSSTQAHADKLILGGFSYHATNREMNYNEVHPAIGLQRDTLELGLTINSIERPSVWVSKLSQPFKFGKFDFGYRLGVGTGYDDKVMDVYEINKYKTTCRPKKHPVCVERNAEKTDFVWRYESHTNIYGIQPIAQLVASTTIDRVTIDFGFSTVSTVIFKYNL